MTNNASKIKRKPFQNVTNSATLGSNNGGKRAGNKQLKVSVQARSNATNIKVVPKISPHDRYLASINNNNVQSQFIYVDSNTPINLRANVNGPDTTCNVDKQSYSTVGNSSSREQIAELIIVLPSNRRHTVEKMKKLVLGGLYRQENRIFTPSFSFSILRAFETFKRQYSETNDSKTHFDLLFGFTYEIWKNDYWMTHHARGWGGEKMISALGVRWNELLQQCTADDLGLDTDISFPSLLWFLKTFKSTVEDVETYGDPKMIFNYAEGPVA